MRHTNRIIVVVVALGLTYASGARAERCESLQSVDFWTVQDAPTRITSATLVDGENERPGYCRVLGYVASQVRFEARLPLRDWNGKFLVLGNGGWGGSVDADRCKGPIKRNYACLATDTGHQARADDGLWAHDNLRAQMDFGFRAIHVAALAGKAIVAEFYSRVPQHSYFMGCSTGGYQGLVESQRFPWDFDGIVAGAPDMDEADLVMRQLWNARMIRDSAGQPTLSEIDLKLLHNAVLQQCDMDDGVKDGIISNPLDCHFNPLILVCKGEKHSTCLTQSQALAANKIYGGPTTSNGTPTSSGGLLPGSELTWKYLGQIPGQSNASALLSDMIYGINPPWKPDDFDFESDYKRLGLAALYTDTNPDLRKYRAAGGKLLVYQGANDVLEGVKGIVDYYQTVERALGGNAVTKDFLRLFIVPGMSHCSADAGAYAIDYLSYLEAWVEQRSAPDVMIGAHVSDIYLANAPVAWEGPPLTPEERVFVAAANVEIPLAASVPVAFTRPIYPYPYYAVWTGKGDVNKAENFRAHAPPKGP